MTLIPLLADLRERLEAQGPLQGASGSVDDGLAELLAAGGAVLARRSRPNGPAGSPPVPPANVLLLAWLTQQDQAAAGVKSWGRPPEEIARRVSKTTLARYSLWLQIVAAAGLDLAALVGDRERFHEVAATHVDSFRKAIAPQRVGNLVKDREALAQRVRAFVNRLPLSDVEFRREVRDMFAAVLEDREDVDRLLSRTSLAKLRTYPAETLRQIAANFAAWDPLVRYLTDEDYRDRCPQLFGEVKRQLDAIRAVIESRVRKRGYPTDGLEDVFQEVVGERLNRYTYEAPLPAWLLAVVLNLIRDATGGSPPTGADGDVDPLLDLVALFLEVWRGRFEELQDSFTTEDSRLQVQVIWESMLAEVASGQPLLQGRNPGDGQASLRELAERIRQCRQQRARPGDDPEAAPPEMTVAANRRRLRQGVAVLHYMLDVVESDAEEDDERLSNEAVFIWVRRLFGLHTNEQRRLERLADWARRRRRERDQPP